MSNPSADNYTHMEPYVSEPPGSQGEAFVTTHPWLRYYEEGVPPHIALPDRPLTWLLDTAASRYPDHTALIYYGTRLSYAQLAHQAKRFAICPS